MTAATGRAGRVERLPALTNHPCMIDRRTSAARNCRPGDHRAVYLVEYAEDGVAHRAHLCPNTCAAVCHQFGIAFPPGPKS